jgi:hypothetical protein
MPSVIRMIKLTRMRFGRTCSTNFEEKECMEDFGENFRRKETTRKT